MKIIEKEGDERNYCVDFSKAKKILKFKIKWNIEKGVREIKKALRKGKIGDYHAPEYSNYKHLINSRAFFLLRNNE